MYHNPLRPELKSLGTPDQPARSSTAIHLGAGRATPTRHLGTPPDMVHAHWRPSPWSKRLHATRSFPLEQGKLSVSRPGLYLVYAQVTLLTHLLEV